MHRLYWGSVSAAFLLSFFFWMPVVQAIECIEEINVQDPYSFRKKKAKQRLHYVELKFVDFSQLAMGSNANCIQFHLSNKGLKPLDKKDLVLREYIGNQLVFEIPLAKDQEDPKGNFWVKHFPDNRNTKSAEQFLPSEKMYIGLPSYFPYITGTQNRNWRVCSKSKGFISSKLSNCFWPKHFNLHVEDAEMVNGFKEEDFLFESAHHTQAKLIEEKTLGIEVDVKKLPYKNSELFRIVRQIPKLPDVTQLHVKTSFENCTKRVKGLEGELFATYWMEGREVRKDFLQIKELWNDMLPTLFSLYSKCPAEYDVLEISFVVKGKLDKASRKALENEMQEIFELRVGGVEISPFFPSYDLKLIEYSSGILRDNIVSSFQKSLKRKNSLASVQTLPFSLQGNDIDESQTPHLFSHITYGKQREPFHINYKTKYGALNHQIEQMPRTCFEGQMFTPHFVRKLNQNKDTNQQSVYSHTETLTPDIKQIELRLTNHHQFYPGLGSQYLIDNILLRQDLPSQNLLLSHNWSAINNEIENRLIIEAEEQGYILAKYLSGKKDIGIIRKEEVSPNTSFEFKVQTKCRLNSSATLVMAVDYYQNDRFIHRQEWRFPTTNTDLFKTYQVYARTCQNYDYATTSIYIEAKRELKEGSYFYLVEPMLYPVKQISDVSGVVHHGEAMTAVVFPKPKKPEVYDCTKNPSSPVLSEELSEVLEDEDHFQTTSPKTTPSICNLEDEDFIIMDDLEDSDFEEIMPMSFKYS